jgi:class 3 adenylate cyclase
MSRVQATILFTDVVGSTAYFERFGDTAGVSMINRHDVLSATVVAECQGRVIKTIGDAVMAEFNSPQEAARAAVEMQRRLWALNQRLEERLRIQIRVAINYGSAIRRNNDLYGDAVNTCARVCKKCGPAQILVTRSVEQAIRGGAWRTEAAGSAPLAGKSDPEELFEIVWTDTGVFREVRQVATTMMARGDLKVREFRFNEEAEVPVWTLPAARWAGGIALAGVLVWAAMVWQHRPDALPQALPPAPLPAPTTTEKPAPVANKPKAPPPRPKAKETPQGDGYISLHSVPAGAQVTIDGAATNYVTNVHLKLPAGKHTIHLQHRRRSATREVVVRPGETQKILVLLRPNKE